MEKSVPPAHFYRSVAASEKGPETLDSLPSTAGPWTPDAQHGGPPAALLARAVERLPEAAGRTVGRFTMELRGPIPVAPLAVSARLVRPGRSVALAQAELVDVARGRVVATAAVWLFPHDEGGPAAPSGPLPHAPGDGTTRERPASWHGGYLDAIDWRWISGAVDRPGPGTVWMRSPDLVEGEPISPLQRLLACVDSASGASSMLDVRQWAFLNTEPGVSRRARRMSASPRWCDGKARARRHTGVVCRATATPPACRLGGVRRRGARREAPSVHVLRPPVGEWVCLDAETTLGPGSVGIASSDVFDERGLVARSRQALLVVRR